MKKEINIFKGFFTEKDKIAPSYINNKNPKYIEIDETYFSGIIIVNFNREYNDLILKNLIDLNIDMNISIFIEKQDSNKAVRDLTNNIANVGVEIKEGNKNKQDIDIALFTYNDAKFIRKEIQVNNEEIYFLYIYINIFSKNKNEIDNILNKIEGILQSIGIYPKKATYRQEQVFLSCLPLMENKKEIKNSACRNILTSGLTGIYPFISSNIFDEEGIFFGTNIYNNSLIFIDKYNTEKYKNANMCVFGTSGSGKSFFIKLQILRNALFDIQQFVIDSEREYTKIAKFLNGEVIKIGPTSGNYINIMDIRQDSIEEQKGFLASKITKLIGFFNLIFGNINEEEKAIIEEKIIECYKNKGITFDDETLFKKYKKNNQIKKEFKKTKDMPLIEDLYNLFEKDKKTEKFKIQLIPFIKGHLKFFNKYTNINTQKNLIIADIYELGEENLKYGMYLFTDLFWDKIKNNRNAKKVIYLDEIWRLIGITSNNTVAGFIYKIFKTIRKFGGSSVAITQDISDIFSLEDGAYGKSIINNSSNKVFFSLEEENIKILSENIKITEKEKIEIGNLRKGECLLFAGQEHMLIKVECDKKEKEIIE